MTVYIGGHGQETDCPDVGFQETGAIAAGKGMQDDYVDFAQERDTIGRQRNINSLLLEQVNDAFGDLHKGISGDEADLFPVSRIYGYRCHFLNRRHFSTGRR